jgi:hypothetical protein
MALADFWRNVRLGARLVAPRVVVVDAPKLDASRIEKGLRLSDVWLTPQSVEGYSEADFSFLPETERRQLTQLVESFRQIAITVPPDERATPQQVEQALPLFRDLVAALEFDRYGDAEAYRLGKLIENGIRGRRPAELAELRFNTGLDQTGDPGLWIWAILTDDTLVDEDQFFAQTERVRKRLDAVARSLEPSRWPYVRFRTVSEQAELTEAQAS